MRDIELENNPTVLKTKVVFRNARGQFTKPHLAAYVEFKPPRSRKPVIYDFPPGRKTKAQALEYAREAVKYEVSSREAEKIKREEVAREKIPAAPRAKKPRLPKIKVGRTSIVTFSKTLGLDVKIVGYNHNFAKKILIDQGNIDNVLAMLKGAMTESALHIYKKDRVKGKYMYLKVFGSGDYMRRRGGKPFRDLLAFSVARFDVHHPSHVLGYIEVLFEDMRRAFMPKSTGRGRMAGYFVERFQDNNFYITGYRIEWAEPLT